MDDGDVADTIIGLRGARTSSPGAPDEDTLLREDIASLVEPRHVQPGTSASAPLLSFSASSSSSSSPMVVRYRFSVNGDAPLPLDVPVLIGRAPRSSRVARGVAPRIVVVDSPLREVSATHLELHQHGSSVIVTDMRSTNGTVITTPGAMDFALRSGESVVALPGTRVNIGDGNTIEIVAVERLLPPGFVPFERLSL